MTQATDHPVTVKVADLTIRPPFVDLFPINPTTLALIRESVLDEGVRDPILVKREADGTLVVVDGHTRLQAAVEGAIEQQRPPEEERVPVIDLGEIADDDAVRRAYRNETQRRKIDPGTLALTVVLNGHEKILVPEAKRPSAKAVGEKIGVSTMTVERARKVAKYDQFATRVLAEADSENRMTLGAAYEAIRKHEANQSRRGSASARPRRPSGSPRRRPPRPSRSTTTSGSPTASLRRRGRPRQSRSRCRPRRSASTTKRSRSRSVWTSARPTG